MAKTRRQPGGLPQRAAARRRRFYPDVFIYLSLLGRLLTSTKPLSRSSRAGADPRKPEIRACLLLPVQEGPQRRAPI